MQATRDNQIYEIVDELQEIVEGTLCYDIMLNQFFIATISVPANTPGLTGRNIKPI